MKLATLCYIQKNNKTLMMHRVKKRNDIHQDKWNGLGGKFEPGETPEQCARREIYEESGLIAEKLVLNGCITFPKFKDNEDWYVFVFTVPEFSGTLVDSPEGELKWINSSDITELNLWEGDRYFLKWMNERKFFSAYFEYKNKQLVSHAVEFYGGIV